MRTEFPNEGEVLMKRLEREHPTAYANHDAGEVVKDHENVDYRHVDTNSMGPGGVSKQEGPDTI